MSFQSTVIPVKVIPVSDILSDIFLVFLKNGLEAMSSVENSTFGIIMGSNMFKPLEC